MNPSFDFDSIPEAQQKLVVRKLKARSWIRSVRANRYLSSLCLDNMPRHFNVDVAATLNIIYVQDRSSQSLGSNSDPTWFIYIYEQAESLRQFIRQNIGQYRNRHFSKVAVSLRFRKHRADVYIRQHMAIIGKLLFEYNLRARIMIMDKGQFLAERDSVIPIFEAMDCVRCFPLFQHIRYPEELPEHSQLYSVVLTSISALSKSLFYIHLVLDNIF